jgi:hypothetical protein
MLGEKWIRFRPGNGTRKKKRRGGQHPQRANNPTQPHRPQLHGLIPENRAQKPKPHRPRNNVRTRVAEGEKVDAEEVGGGVEEAVEGGKVKVETKPRILSSPVKVIQQSLARLRRDSDGLCNIPAFE